MLVSVIVPAYNVAPYLRRCLSSLRAQTLPEIEFIVVDDQSTDGIAAVLDEFQATAPNLSVIRPNTNVGVHAARALGVQAAKGQYIGFVDGDDWIAPEMFRRLLSAAVDNDADIAMCGAVSAMGPDEIVGNKVKFAREEVVVSGILERFCELNFGSGVLWNKLYRASVIRPAATLALERSVDAAEDYVVNFGAFARARRVVTVPEQLYFYYVAPTTATRRASRAASFCRTLRAYVVCLETYRTFAPDAVKLIDRLYTRQLQFESYRVESSEGLMEWNDHLRSSLTRLAEVHPAGVYSLIHTFDAAASIERKSTTLPRAQRADGRSSPLKTWWRRARRLVRS